MSKNTKLQVRFSLAFLTFWIISITSLSAQKGDRVMPKWNFGQSVGINFNTFRGYTQQLNGQLLAPTPFQNGEGIKPYASLFVEYLPYKHSGIILNLAYDNRGGSFKEVLAPCNCPANLSTSLSYLAIEPSIKVMPFGGSLYLFGGPTFLLNIDKSFAYSQLLQANVQGDFDQVRNNLYAAQVGLGFDVPLSAKNNATQIVLSPFASFQTDLGNTPRVSENWSIYTFRFGLALKMGAKRKVQMDLPISTGSVARMYNKENEYKKELQFVVRAPKIIPKYRRIKEILPLRNSVFFDLGSNEIPKRYVQITPKEAIGFKEIQMVQTEPIDLGEGRSSRQLMVYHQILNITGDRMRSAPSSVIYLVGSADNSPSGGTAMAEKVKDYLMTVFSIDSSRILVEGRALPMIPSEQKGGLRELDLLHEGDRRVDIFSVSSALLEQVGNASNKQLKYVDLVSLQDSPLDSHVLLTNTNASDLLNSWTVQLTDEKGVMQSFGPFTKDQVSIPGKSILGNNSFGNYKIRMTGVAKDGQSIIKESFVSLQKADESKKSIGYRFSILFEFDQSKSIASYENFLIKTVSPYITNHSTVVIHGHTDAIGEEPYNQKLSEERAKGVQMILEKNLKGQVNRNVKFEAYGFGESEAFAPFGNTLPEERFYNRCVIIDIFPTNE